MEMDAIHGDNFLYYFDQKQYQEGILVLLCWCMYTGKVFSHFLNIAFSSMKAKKGV